MSFLAEPPPSPEVERLYDADVAGDGYVMDLTRLWAHQPNPSVAVASLTGGSPSDDPADQALAEWARRGVRDPSATTAADVQPLRDAGFDDHQIFAITLYVGLRLAFSTVNAALGATPDPEVLDAAPVEVREAVTWGRPVQVTECASAEVRPTSTSGGRASTTSRKS